MSALLGKTVAISISDAPDRGKLGLPAREIERAAFTLCTALVRSGAKIQYAGDLRPDGWTFKIFRHLAGAYAGHGDATFIHIIPEPVLRGTPFATLVDMTREGRGMVQSLVVIGERLMALWPDDGGLLADPEGAQVQLRDSSALAAWLIGFPTSSPQDAFCIARRLAVSTSHARIALGGKMGILDQPSDGYQGKMPGIAEEAILTLEANKPFLPLGAFGGAARDVAIALALLPASARVPRAPQAESYSASMQSLQRLQLAIPANVRARLKTIAGSDRTERVAREMIEIITLWMHPSRVSADHQGSN